MISAKRMAFRQEIRRKQIDQTFKRRRIQLLQLERASIRQEQPAEFITQFNNICHNLRQLSKQNMYYVYSCLKDLLSLIKSRPKYIIIIIQPQHRIIELISQILNAINEKGQISTSLAIFQICIQILMLLAQDQALKSDRILQSGVIDQLAIFMHENVQKKKTMQQLLNVFANSVKDSTPVANQCTRLYVPSLVINQIKQSNIDIKDKVINQFLLFLRNYFEEIEKLQFLTNDQLNLCLGASIQTIDRLMLPSQLDENQNYQLLQDALVVFKQLLNFDEIKLDINQVNYQSLITIIETKNYPFQVKKQALHLIDCIVYRADQQIVQDLVIRKQLLHKIWNISDEIKYIAINILSNVATYPHLSKQVFQHLPRMKLQLKFFPQKKFVYRLIYNYFYAKKFQISGPTEQSLINQLWNVQHCNKQVLQIQANIWLNLCIHKKCSKPPLRILQAKDIQAVQLLHKYMQGQEIDMEDDEIICQ